MSTPAHFSMRPEVRWLRELASHVDFAHFRRLWLHPVTEQAEQGFIAACYENVARRANSEGEYYLAHDAANHGLRCAAAAQFPPHRLVAAKVTAMARSGATESAQQVLEEFLQSHEADASVASAQARLLRDTGLAAQGGERRGLLVEAAAWAAKAKVAAEKEGGDWAYPANQEAQFHFLAGERAIAEACALAVIEFVNARMDEDSMWDHTNLAEMHLVLGDLENAGLHYQRAGTLGAAMPGDLAANHSVAALLLGELGRHIAVDDSVLAAWFPKPVLVVFTGHMPDAPGRATPRLPESLCRPRGVAATAIAERIRALGAVEGIAAGAPGGDVIFAEELLAAGARFTLVNPFPQARVLGVAENFAHDWPERLERVMAAATRTESIACAEDADEAAQCEYGNEVMLGLAMLRAKRVNGRLHIIALWDEADAAAPKRGGTGHFVGLCRGAGVPVEIINPQTL